ncbi:MAG: hypothetical protein IT426_09225 [Pirellulales bacterium]|nr:hypothetical protein [Pirellulales bacterium]
MFSCAAVHAQNAIPSAEKSKAANEVPGAAAQNPSALLNAEQKRIADKYKHIEEVVLRMAELNAHSDPRRAALLKKAFELSKENLIDVEFERIAELLSKDQLSRALENQAELNKNLQAVLELLLSENRSKRIESEKARIREYLKRLEGIIKQEKDVAARTLADDDLKRLAGEQNKIAEKTGGLAKDIKEKEEGKEKAEGKGKGEGGRGKAEKDNPSEKEQESKGESKDQKGEGKPQEGKPSEGQGPPNPAQGQPQEQNPQQSDNPARKRLEEAQKRMQEAEQKLQEAQKQGAAEKQEQAIRELEQAKAELEEILRQLRQEEIARTLAMLEARFKKMLAMQVEVYEGTVRLDRVPEAERTHDQEIESSRLSGRELQIVVEADKAIVLLREDGTAVAFPEAVEQMRGDMRQVVDRLSQAKVGQITQSIEQDIIAALKETIEALKKAQKDQENQNKKPPPPQEGQPQDPPLVDVLAELKMIRALQMRVNGRTERYSKLIEGEQAQQPDLLDALQKLAERQERIHRVTRDLQKEQLEK